MIVSTEELPPLVSRMSKYIENSFKARKASIRTSEVSDSFGVFNRGCTGIIELPVSS